MKRERQYLHWERTRAGAYSLYRSTSRRDRPADIIPASVKLLKGSLRVWLWSILGARGWEYRLIDAKRAVHQALAAKAIRGERTC
jgi:hypothetical protein